MNLLIKYGHIKVSQSMGNLLLQMTDEQRLKIFEWIADYEKQINAAIKKEDSKNVFAAIHETLNEAMKQDKHLPEGKTIQCKKGCAACCHIQVTITELEAKAIWEFCKDNDISIDLDYLKKQHPLNEQTHPKSEHSACMFLDRTDNSCKIYEIRPIACSKYHVVSDPVFCDAKKFTKHEVMRYVNLHQEILSSAVHTCAKDHDSIARMLLKTKPVEKFES